MLVTMTLSLTVTKNIKKMTVYIRFSSSAVHAWCAMHACTPLRPTILNMLIIAVDNFVLFCVTWLKNFHICYFCTIIKLLRIYVV